ncbi:unnamed protein product [Arabidopsis lyrata]|nr:unnamed protein product [Arabidopsis lyrata]
MDIIGSLPDDILCHILSFFPIKEAALTSLLSKRWRNLFVFIPNLHLDYFNYRNNPNNYTSFRDFVDRVLTVSGNSPLKKFALKHPQSNDAARVNSWICNVLSRGVLDLNLYLDALLSACHVLEELTITTFDLSRRKTVTDGYPIVNFDSLVEAKLTLASRKHPQKGSPENLIKGLRNVEILELSSFQTSETFYSFRKSIPVFKNLLHLSVTTDSRDCCRCLPLLLKNSPNLRTLLLKGPLHCDRRWPAREPVCMCFSGLESCPVEVLEITEYKGTKDNLEHMKNFLEKLLCLELVKVCACETDDEKKLKLTNDLLRLRGPSKCKIQFQFIAS